MAQKPNQVISMKRLGVDKANSRVVAITTIAAFLSVFFLVASYSLLGQLTYQNKIIGAKNKAVNQLKANLGARDSLVSSYNSFASAPQNFIGGASDGAGPQDGSNPKLVLDALPSTYDFPALTTSLEKIATDQHVSIESLEGADDEVAQSAPIKGDPQPVQMPFTFKVTGDYPSITKTVDAFDKSIRPVQFTQLKISGEAAANGDKTPRVSAEITAASYYQPAKTLTIKKEAIKK